MFPRDVLAVAAVNPRFLVDARQTPIDVVVTIEEWRSIVEELEELEDIRAYDAAVAEKQKSTPLERVAAEIRERREP
ncbi:MAG: hypothetical protein FJ275_14350 [Planctomycetes bacterium]|nr:hypothetical protein [Planctomycetota bacterium]